MKDWIANLLVLQETDLRLRQLHDRLDLLPRELARLEGELAASRARAGAAKDQIKAAELAVRQVENEIKTEHEAILKLQQQSINVKKNEEYRALLNEIAHHRRRIGDHETRQLEQMERADAAKASLRDVEKALTDQARTVEVERVEFKDLAAKLQAEIARLREERGAQAVKVAEHVLTQYERLLGRAGAPLVKVEDDMCGNCHLKVTPQTANQARKGQHVICDHCGHLLYAD